MVLVVDRANLDPVSARRLLHNEVLGARRCLVIDNLIDGPLVRDNEQLQSLQICFDLGGTLAALARALLDCEGKHV